MKRLALVATMLLAFVTTVFAQADLKPLAVIKLNKSETVTLKQLKTRVEMYQKQSQGQKTSFTLDEKKQILDAIIDEKLITQAAQKAGITLTDTQVNQYFLQSLSQQAGRTVTEAQFAEMVKKETGLSFDDYMKQALGMTVIEYKAYLKNQLIAQQYILKEKGSEIQKVAATDKEIRDFYELNKSNFAQNDMIKIFLVVIPKGSDAEGARTKANKLLNDLKDKKTTCDTIKKNAASDKTYQGGDLLIQKSAANAQQLGISVKDLNELFERKDGFISDLNETANDWQFYTVRQKYSAKMLSISDVVQPETTITVYDYIKQNLTIQKQQMAMINAINDLTKSLNTPENVKRSVTGDKLDKLLNW